MKTNLDSRFSSSLREADVTEEQLRIKLARLKAEAKGHPFDRIPAGESIELVNVKGRGVINRIWLTISDRSPEMLRSLKIEMFWDGKSQPAVSVPLGDFFGVGLGKRVAFESAFFSDPEGRSFNCIIPMPFKTGARITVTNESDKQLDAIFYDVNMVQKKHEGKDLLYFHAKHKHQLLCYINL